MIEPQERDAYADTFPADKLIELPFSNRGLHATRNWIKAHSIARGAARHWQLDDNLYRMYRLHGRRRLPMRMGLGLAIIEDFCDRYTNIAVAGCNYQMFVVPINDQPPPYYLNTHVYSCSLILNAIPNEWRRVYNDDTDLCLQVLADGWCTVSFNALCVKKVATLAMKGGNNPIYLGDGRLKMARSLERDWPGVVSVDRRFQRPQHVITGNWTKFDTPLKRRTDIDWSAIQGTNDFGMVLPD